MIAPTTITNERNNAAYNARTIIGQKLGDEVRLLAASVKKNDDCGISAAPSENPVWVAST